MHTYIYKKYKSALCYLSFDKRKWLQWSTLAQIHSEVFSGVVITFELIREDRLDDIS